MPGRFKRPSYGQVASNAPRRRSQGSQRATAPDLLNSHGNLDIDRPTDMGAGEPHGARSGEHRLAHFLQDTARSAHPLGRLYLDNDVGMSTPV